ncbi:MAG: SpoIID/LytB domain-containing protein [Actinobacteria bacterium]|nr:SpoIID/LytB domain-containing protein [Actinomycetota bacterium]
MRRAALPLALSVLATGWAPSVASAAGPSGEPVGVVRSAAGPSFRFDGGGWGHGVGMSQYGARGRATNGATYSQILGSYYQSTAVETQPGPDDLRVLLGEPANTVLTPTGAVSFELNGTPIATAPGSGDTTVAAVGEQFQASGQASFGPLGGPADTLYVTFAGGGPMRVSTTGNRYQYGRLAITIAGPGVLRVVLQGLGMDQYLYGLGEMPSSWPAEALKAQAVAGRSYAKNVAARRRAQDPPAPFDLYASVQDQAYVGYEKEVGASGSSWVAAVNATSGQVVTYQGSVIQAFYHSSSGGHTENSENVFAQALPYLKGVPDPEDGYDSPRHRWSRTYTADQLSTWLARFADTNVGTVSSISLLGPFGVSGRVDKATARLVGSAGTKDVTGARFRQVVNSGISNDGGGLDVQLLSTSLVTTIDPFGSLDLAVGTEAGVRVAGWALDPNTADPIDVHVYVDGAIATALTASAVRSDIEAAYPSYGSNHGFDTTVAVGPGDHSVCAYAINVYAGTNVLLGCRTVATNPFGSFDTLTGAGGGVRVEGWALDPNTADPIDVHAYVDGSFAGAVRSSLSRTDLAGPYPGLGTDHGFSALVPAGGGNRNVCLYAINVGPGTNRLIACRQIVLGADPFGSFDRVSAGEAGVRVGGWALDPNATGPIDVHAYVDGAFAGAFPADVARADIAGAFPGFGGSHGFDALIGAQLPGGSHNVCIYGINVGTGTNSFIGCRSVVVQQSPVGSFDVLRSLPGALQVDGWAFDPGTSDSIGVHAYIDGAFAGAFTADVARPDVEGAYPGIGANHGFHALLGADAGAHNVCLYGINVGAGTNTFIACRQVTVPSDPLGSLDVVAASAGGIRVAGWAVDLSTDASVKVHVYLDGAFVGELNADTSRTDVAQGMGGSDLRGFDTTIAAAGGAHTVCVYGINVGVGSNSLIACRQVTI